MISMRHLIERCMRVSREYVHHVWKSLEETYEGTSVKRAKLYILKENYFKFTMMEGESVAKMFHRINMIVNGLKSLGYKVDDEDFSHKFLRSLPPPRFSTIVTIIVKGGLDKMAPTQVLGEVVTHETFNLEVSEPQVMEDGKKKKSITFRATSSKAKKKER